jgi:hypothetical protein
MLNKYAYVAGRYISAVTQILAADEEKGQTLAPARLPCRNTGRNPMNAKAGLGSQCLLKWSTHFQSSI